MTAPAPAALADLDLAARILAIDPALGAAVGASPGPALDAWLDAVRAHLPAGAPWRRLPPGTPDGRLVGGLDLAATLATGRLVAARGLLAEADGGLLVVPSAERLDAVPAAQICRAIDTGVARVERDGIAAEAAARIGVVLLDDGRSDDERPDRALMDRAAIRLRLTCDLAPAAPPDPAAAARARARLRGVEAGPEVVDALCRASDSLGIEGMRAPILALRVARAAAALAGSDVVGADEIAAAARLVLAHRATRLPSRGEASPPPDPGEDADGADRDGEPDRGATSPVEVAVAAAAASVPADALAALTAGAAHGAWRSGARRGAPARAGRRGRPVGAARGEPGRETRLDLLATLRAAAPWQAARGRSGPVRVRREDLRVKRFRDRQRTTTIFAVDASGSAALGRLAEAKGAVELLLAECYVRRDEVALVAFRGAKAEVLLPPTRAPARARRALAALPGGGPTPLAAGIAAAHEVALAAARDGRRPVIAVLTDGQANIARDGAADRARAAADASAAAARVRADGIAAMVIDVSPRPRPAAAGLARAMGARYLPLPAADAGGIARSLRATTAETRA